METGENGSTRGKPRNDKKLSKVKGGRDRQVKIRTEVKIKITDLPNKG